MNDTSAGDRKILYFMLGISSAALVIAGVVALMREDPAEWITVLLASTVVAGMSAASTFVSRRGVPGDSGPTTVGSVTVEATKIDAPPPTSAPVTTADLKIPDIA